MRRSRRRVFLTCWDAVVGSYAIPVLNSTQNYVPPQKDSTADLKCDCDTVMYRYAFAKRAEGHGGQLAHWWRMRIRTQSLHGVHGVSGRCDLFVSIPCLPAFSVRVRGLMICGWHAVGRGGSGSVMLFAYHSECCSLALRGFGLQDLPDWF